MKIKILCLTTLLLPVIAACSQTTNQTQTKANECPTQPQADRKSVV